MDKIKEEADKHSSKLNKKSMKYSEFTHYKDYFRSQIDELRNEMLQKKANMDKMKLLLEHYKAKVSELEQELVGTNERWAKICEDERKKWKIYLHQ